MDSDNGWVPGSWGRPGHLQNPTNVTRIARAIMDYDEGNHPQIVYYQAGIGTGIGLYNHLVGGGTGLGIDDNIREAYAFLASNYAERREGVESDSIFLLGFSRGAYTARSLGGLICALGVLKRHAMPHFYEMFYDWEMAGDKHHTPLFFKSYFKHHDDVHEVQPPIKLARDKSRRDEYLALYKQYLLDLGLTQEAEIKCIGVWDTVGALGIPVNPVFQQFFPSLPSFIRKSRWFDTRLDSKVHHAFHALALDERRSPYSPALWEKRDDCTTRLKQVWFPGAHSNVGGSYSDAGTADITLAWMMDQLAGNTTEHPDGFVHHDWIKFDNEFVNQSYDCRLNYYSKHKLSAYKPWGRGKVYDSDTFPQSLAGQKMRVPGKYHRTVYETGISDPKHLLQDTNEYVHACVRVRIDLAGRGLEPDLDEGIGMSIPKLLSFCWHQITGAVGPRNLYQPQWKAGRKGGPLRDWRLEDGHESHREPNLELCVKKPERCDGVRWVYEGSDKVEGRVMLEDRLGPYETLLLRKDKEVADQVLFTNNEWRPVERHDRSVRPAKTF